MTVRAFVAKQFMCPSGPFGRYAMGWVMNRLNSRHCDLVREVLAVAPTDRVLEVGFGGGALLARLCQEASEGFVAGVDVSDAMLASAEKRLRTQIASGRLSVQRGRAESLPFGDREFDKACSVNTTYFWRDLDAGLLELARVLRVGGRLVLGFVSPEYIVGAGLDRQGFASHSPDQLEAALRRTGFRPEGVRTGSDARGTLYASSAERVG